MEIKCLGFECPYYERTRDYAYEASYGCSLEDCEPHDLPDYCPYHDSYPEADHE